MKWTQDMSKRALIVGVAGAAVCAVGIATAGKEQFFQSYLTGFVFVFGIAFGSLGLQMIHALTGGRWGIVCRRQTYAASTSLPVLAALFLPILLGLKVLYPWARPEVVAKDQLLQHKALYLNVPFFVGRTAVMFAIWCAIALVLYKRSIKRGLHRPSSSKMRTLSGPGLLICALTMTVASIDWLMSLDPHWFSTMFGVIVIVGQLLSGMAFAIVMLLFDCKKRGVEVPIDHMHDLGNLLLVFVMLWAYVAFSQYLIIYAGNMAEDVPWYVHRSAEGWQYLSLAVIILHFLVPFVVLMSKRSKRRPKILGTLAVAMLLMRFVECFWVTAPNFDHHFKAHWLDLAAPIAIGGFWAAYFFRRFGRKELEPEAA